MSEREMRQILASLCADLDRRARALGRGVKKALVPAALGAGLALGAGACSDDASSPKDARVEASTKDMGAEMSPLYMAPEDAAIQSDVGPTADVGVDLPGTLYMAPDAGTDVGPVPPYMAPGDGGGGILYQAPDAS